MRPPASTNPSQRVARPAACCRRCLPVSVSSLASGLTNPRWMAVAPNGDVFLAEPGAGRITLLHEKDGKVQASTFADGFQTPHGLVLPRTRSMSAICRPCGASPIRTAREPAGKRERVTKRRRSQSHRQSL